MENTQHHESKRFTSRPDTHVRPVAGGSAAGRALGAGAGDTAEGGGADEAVSGADERRPRRGPGRASGAPAQRPPRAAGPGAPSAELRSFYPVPELCRRPTDMPFSVPLFYSSENIVILCFGRCRVLWDLQQQTQLAVYPCSNLQANSQATLMAKVD